MKIFAKRKGGADAAAATATGDSPTNTPNKVNKGDHNDAVVASYFSPNFRPPSSQICHKKAEAKNVVDDIEELLAMDPSTLNSKQRRLIRRHVERTEDLIIADEEVASTIVIAEHETTTNLPVKKNDDANSSDEIAAEPHSDDMQSGANNKHDDKCVGYEILPKMSNGVDETRVAATQQMTVDSEALRTQQRAKRGTDKSSDEEITTTQLKGLNSKERRKLLRRLRRDVTEEEGGFHQIDSSGSAKGMTTKGNGLLLAEAEEQARIIARQNIHLEREEREEKKKKRKLKEEEETSLSKSNNEKTMETNNVTLLPSSKMKKDFSHLPSKERERREQQRRMQEEAKERRDRCRSDDGGNVRHPLNSERRRANRRKPGKGKLIATFKKEGKERQAVVSNYHAVGYQIRKQRRQHQHDPYPSSSSIV